MTHHWQGGLKSILKFATDPISTFLFNTAVNPSKPANFVGTKSFVQILSSCQAQISGNGSIHKIGLTASDYLANPVVSSLPSAVNIAPKPSQSEHHVDGDSENNSEIYFVDPNDTATGKNVESTPNPQPAHLSR